MANDAWLVRILKDEGMRDYSTVTQSLGERADFVAKYARAGLRPSGSPTQSPSGPRKPMVSTAPASRRSVSK
jgi:hypothetical protein